MSKFKTLGELKGYSSVDITSKSFDEILVFNDKCRKEGNGQLSFPLQEGVFILNILRENIGMPSIVQEMMKDVKYYIYFKLNLGEKDKLGVLMEAYMYDTKKFELMQLNASNVIFSGEKGLDIQPLKYSNEDKTTYNQLMLNHFSKKDGATMLFQTLLESLIYVGLIQANRKVVYRESKGLKYGSSNNTTKSKSNLYEKVEVLNEDKVMYTLNGKREELKTFRSYTRSAESWMVLGHPRHYKKTNTTIWIDPYVKGNGKAKPKNYKIK